ncbi:MAG: hypothetical protein H6642_11715 [Caldilineaceae bacterium]|nr:hypothetical protein [Caldilineaceae bacterium]
MSDIYQDLVKEQWPQIAELYNQHAAQRPVILLDVNESELFAYPFDQLAEILDESSRASFGEQYARAVATRQMVLLVRDQKNKQLLTYTLKLEDEDAA